MSKFIQTRDVVLCDDHMNEKLDDCLHCRITDLEAERDSHAIANVNANCTIAELKLLIVRAYTNGYGRGHNDTVESVYTDVFPCDQDTYFAEEVSEWIKEQEAIK